MSAGRKTIDGDGHVVRVYDLYHRTDAEAATKIAQTGTFVSHCHAAGEAYFANRPRGRYSSSYGEAVVHVEVPTHAAIEDEVFRDGEVFYRVPLADLSSARVVCIDITGSDTPT